MLGFGKCSTPCGINEVVTILPKVSAATVYLCAQRLAASTKLSPLRSGRGFALECRAQRLAASTKLSHAQPECENPKPSQVLNALRHQRSCHLVDVPYIVIAALLVLNALRHQRSCHNRSLMPAAFMVGAQRLAASTKLSHYSSSGIGRLATSAQRLAASTKLSRHCA